MNWGKTRRMQPIGPLMIEHRLIEKLIAHVDCVVSDARSRGRMDPVLVDSAVDFVRTYADRTPSSRTESWGLSAEST